MWIATPTAMRLGLGDEFFNRCPRHVTQPGAAFLKNSEQLYGLWFFALNAFMEWESREQNLEIGEPDENGLRTFQGRAAFGALKTTTYWLTAILATLVEAYIKDVLTFAAEVDASVMKACPVDSPSRGKAKQSAKEGRSAALSARSWARAWLRAHKGPHEWVRGFEELGVIGLDSDLGDRLHELVGVRHLVVHAAGVVDEEYLQHHPASPWPLGSEALLDDDAIRAFIRTTFDFFAPIEAHFVGQYIRGRS